jgi:DNA-binding transcriptional MocR family regulator
MGDARERLAICGLAARLFLCSANSPARQAYMIDAFEREQDRWRAIIRRHDGMRIWVAVPPSEHESVTTSADALTAKGAIDLAKQAIDGGGMI